MNYIKCGPHRSKAQRWIFMLLAVVMVLGVLTGFTYPAASAATKINRLPPISTYPYAGPCNPWPDDPYPYPWPGDPYPWPNPDPWPSDPSPYPWLK